jgi:hypothetical protein
MDYCTDAADIKHWNSASCVKFVLVFQSVVHGIWLGMGCGTDSANIEHCNSASLVKFVLVFQSVVHGTWLGIATALMLPILSTGTQFLVLNLLWFSSP